MNDFSNVEAAEKAFDLLCEAEVLRRLGDVSAVAAERRALAREHLYGICRISERAQALIAEEIAALAT